MQETKGGQSASGQPDAGAPALWRRWGQFLTGMAAILLFAFVVIPAIQRLGAIREVRRVIENRGVDATALIYSDSEVSCEAESCIRNAIRYAAQPLAESSPVRGKQDQSSPRR
jgi:hypothetical protein